jgi:hypothetical protein
MGEEPVKRIGVAMGWIALATGIAGAVPPAAPANSPPDLTAEQMRQDLAVMVDALRRKHPGLYHLTPKEMFDRNVADLDSRLGRLNPDEAFVVFNRITAAVGDAHTFVDRREGAPQMPLVIRKYGDDFRVVAVQRGYERAVGTKVVAVGGVPIASAFAKALELAANDENMPLREGWAADFLSRGELLHGLGLSPSGSHAVFTLAGDDGKPFDLPVDALPAEAAGPWVSAARAIPLAGTHPGESFWCAAIEEARTVYCNLRRYDDLASKTRQMTDLLAREKPAKLVIDLRQAVTGGDYKVGRAYLIGPLRDDPGINRKGKLFVLIGPMTFSASMANAAQFRSETAATLVGRPIGEKPNSWSEVDKTRLPNTGWTLHRSTRFYEFAKGEENMIRPDVEIKATWDDALAGRDPVLQWVLAQP